MKKERCESSCKLKLKAKKSRNPRETLDRDNHRKVGFKFIIVGTFGQVKHRLEQRRDAEF